jgi:hypothetical protein
MTQFNVSFPYWYTVILEAGIRCLQANDKMIDGRIILKYDLIK